MTNLTTAILFSIANESKNSGIYLPANLAWASLLEIAKKDKKIKFEWENQDFPFYIRNEGDLQNNTIYYDLCVIVLGDKSLCIPAPMLNAKTLEFFLGEAEQIEKREHNRSTKKVLDKERVALEKIQLILKYSPKTWDYARDFFTGEQYKSMQEQYQALFNIVSIV